MHLDWGWKTHCTKNKGLENNSKLEMSHITGFHRCLVVRSLPVNAGVMGLIPGSGWPPWKGSGNTLQNSCLGNPPWTREVWWATKIWTWLSNWAQYGGGLVIKSYSTLGTPWTIACKAPLSMGFSRQEYWSGLPFPPPGDLPNLGIEPTAPA